MALISKNIANRLAQRGNDIILNTKSLYLWDDIIKGVNVKRGEGEIFKERAVDRKTWRVFWRKDKDKVGASDIFDNYFLNQKDGIIKIIKSIKNRKQLDEYEDFIISDLKPQIEKIISPKKKHLIEHYNTLRKPLDLYFENLISMSKELENIRCNITEFLYVPLDNVILNLIPNSLLIKHNIEPGDGFTFVRTKKSYVDIQNYISDEVTKTNNEVGVKIFPIYIELLWGDRYLNSGENFWETNRGK